MSGSASRHALTRERLSEVLEYDAIVGEFRWKKPTSPRMRVGSVAGTINHDGYRVIAIDREHFRAGRLAWFYTHGRWPEPEIDHINRIRLDDRIDNLREATRSEQLRNRQV